MMGEFKRSPSKVWWASEAMDYRDSTASPGSQDSGFSDTENSPPSQAVLPKKQNDGTAHSAISTKVLRSDIIKESSAEKPQNLNSNFVEKHTPNKKSITNKLISEAGTKSEPKRILTPQQEQDNIPKSEPPRRHRYAKHSPKVSRNLFNTRHKESSKDVLPSHQYSQDVIQETTRSSINCELTPNDSHSWLSNDSVQRPYSSQTVPNLKDSYKKYNYFSNQTAPAVLKDTKDSNNSSCDNSLSSDCESELECLFNANLNSPTPHHTSTPKVPQLESMRHRRKKLYSRLTPTDSHRGRVTPVLTEGDVDNEAVKQWYEELREHYEQECMTALQCKSIMGELNQKISRIANRITSRIRDIISHAHCIEKEYRTLNSETRHIGPLAQSLAGNIIEYIRTYTNEMTVKINKQYDEIRKGTEDSLAILNTLLTTWQSIHCELLENEIRRLIDRLEDPSSELDLRATVTGITSLALRNEELIQTFIKADIISTLIILCEKCEGPSVRSLLLRALSTMCCNSVAVRQLEKFSGIQIIVESIQDESRPEPERSEAVALLAQVTAPWIEDNHSIRGLQDHSKKLVKSLTKIITSTKCCQNLLLCLAALANLTTMDSTCIKYLLQQKTVPGILDVIERKGPLVSIYVLEQAATLLANMSVVEQAREQLTEAGAPAALLCFLQRVSSDEHIEKRLQQKTIIALSRLCKFRKAAEEIVRMGGVQVLVKLCKDKDARYDSDAVLVASLATLRKIADVCGMDIVSAEDAQELVEPKLLDSFRAYSSQNESYV